MWFCSFQLIKIAWKTLNSMMTFSDDCVEWKSREKKLLLILLMKGPLTYCVVPCCFGNIICHSCWSLHLPICLLQWDIQWHFPVTFILKDMLFFTWSSFPFFYIQFNWFRSQLLNLFNKCVSINLCKCVGDT